MKANDINNSLAWSFVALDKDKAEKYEAHLLTGEDIMKKIASAYYIAGDNKSAAKWVNKILSTKKPATIKYSDLVKELQDAQINSTQKQLQKKNKLWRHKLKDKEMFSSLCRYEIKVPESLSKSLKCRYQTRSPFLKLTPMKVEQLYKNPNIFLFYDILEQKEIQHLQFIAGSKNASNSDTESINKRDFYVNSKWSNQHEKNSNVLEKVSRRISDITGWRMTLEGHFHVVTYGIGGYSRPHYDDYLNFPKLQKNGRLATLLFYLSEVEQGGSTVFIKLGLAVSPVKGAALYWENQHTTGITEEATLHADCPVLHGTKLTAKTLLNQPVKESLQLCPRKS